MTDIDQWRREDLGHHYCYRVTDPQLRDAFFHIVNDLYGVTNRGGGSGGDRRRSGRRRAQDLRFQGAVPCSIMRSDLDLLRRDHYVAFEKTDGTRYLMLCTVLNNSVPFCVLIDRQWVARIVRLQFDPEVYERTTLFDGELVQNQQTGRWTFLIFDLVSSGYASSSRDNYVKRMKVAQQIVRGSLRRDSMNDAFDLQVKRYEHLDDMERLRSAEREYKGFPTDGYIFMPVTRHVHPFRNRQILKWKELNNNTIDLELRYGADRRLEYWLKDTDNRPKFFEHVPLDNTISFEHSQLMQQCAERVRAGRHVIVECAYDEQRSLWVMTKERPDKQTPNAEYTVQRTLENIRENITKEELFHVIDNERVNPRRRQRQQPQQEQQCQQRPQFSAPVFDEDRYAHHQQQQQQQQQQYYPSHQNQTQHQRQQQQHQQQQPTSWLSANHVPSSSKGLLAHQEQIPYYAMPLNNNNVRLDVPPQLSAAPPSSRPNGLETTFNRQQHNSRDVRGTQQSPSYDSVSPACVPPNPDYASPPSHFLPPDSDDDEKDKDDDDDEGAERSRKKQRVGYEPEYPGYNGEHYTVLRPQQEGLRQQPQPPPPPQPQPQPQPLDCHPVLVGDDDDEEEEEGRNDANNDVSGGGGSLQPSGSNLLQSLSQLTKTLNENPNGSLARAIEEFKQQRQQQTTV